MTTAYFSMEVGLKSSLRTYSGGLGILGGDHLKEAADMGLDMVGVTLFYSKGYFQQHLSPDGWQTESYPVLDPNGHLKPLEEIVTVPIEGRQVKLRAWRYDVVGRTGHVVPVYFLDAEGVGNPEWDANLTHNLYGGGHQYHRIAQEALLGIGGHRMLRKLGYDPEVYHMNEGHAAFLTLDLLRELGSPDKVREKTVFTTHTPVAAGHDRFNYELAGRVIGSMFPANIREYAGEHDLSMTLLAMNLSRYTNAVAKKHAEVSRAMFPGRTIDHITNGVHSFTWTAPEFQRLYDSYIPSWRSDPRNLSFVSGVSLGDIQSAHEGAKGRLIEYLADQGINYDPEILTLGFARRAATYKRADLIFKDIERFRKIAGGKVQIVYAGKAHPMDNPGKDAIRRVHGAARILGDDVKVVYLENYNMDLGALLTGGVDIWVNTPQRPREASGTSGEKAVHNGVPNDSVLDGWWIEGHREGVTGWAIGPEPTENGLVHVNDHEDADSFYTKLEDIIIPMYYGDPKAFAEVRRNAISMNASYFNTRRMLSEYIAKAYFPK